MSTLIRNIKKYTNISDADKSTLRKFLHSTNGFLYQGNLSIEMINDIINITVDQDDSRTIIKCHDLTMEVWVGRNYIESSTSWSSEYEFNMSYTITPEWLFQISTQYDLGFIEFNHIKHLRKIHEYYSKCFVGFEV